MHVSSHASEFVAGDLVQTPFYVSKTFWCTFLPAPELQVLQRVFHNAISGDSCLEGGIHITVHSSGLGMDHTVFTSL